MYRHKYGQVPVLHQQVFHRNQERRYRFPLVVMDEAVHEEERLALRKDLADIYIIERVHFQKS